MRIAADNGYSKAQVTYANLIVDSQPQEAKKYYEMATNSDDAYAHAILGKHYYLGTFGKKGKELAKYHLLLARRIGLEEKMLQAVNDLLEHL